MNQVQEFKEVLQLKEKIHFSAAWAVLDSFAQYIKKSALGLHLYYPAPRGAADQWPLKM